MDNTEFDVEVRRKKQLARKILKGKRAEKEFLCDQIEVCEGLCLPISEEMIFNLVLLPINEMKNEIRRHKRFA